MNSAEVIGYLVKHWPGLINDGELEAMNESDSDTKGDTKGEL